MFLKNLFSGKKIFFILAVIFFGFLIIDPVLAAAGGYTPLVKIPGINPNAGLLPYLNGVYTFLVSVVGILAMAVLIYGGMRYITSAGNTASIGEAKESINSALAGLILALLSWVFFATINKDILVLKPVGVTAPWGKYEYGGGNPLNNCVTNSLQRDQSDTSTSPCECADQKSVTFTKSKDPVGPYVINTSIYPCSTNVSYSLTNQIIFTFNESLKKDSVVLNASVFGTTAITPFKPNKIILSGNNLIISWPESKLNAGVRQTFIIKGGGSGVKNEKGEAMENDYQLSFTDKALFEGIPCVRPTPAIITCKDACSNPATPGLSPKGYHCMKADLKVGSSAHPNSDSPALKAGQTFFFDARSGSVDYAYIPLNLKGDPYKADSGFDNGIDRYEICFDKGCTVFADYACSDPMPGTCNPLLAKIGFAIRAFSYWGVCGIDSMDKSIKSYSFSEPGTYTWKLRAYSRSHCNEYAEKEINITVSP